MKIYVNENYEILSIDKAPDTYAKEIEVLGTRAQLFGNLCDLVIQGYKYEQQYEFLFGDDGYNLRDEETYELLYKLDENGNKIPAGYALYPFVDYKILTMIQDQYEENQRLRQDILAFVAESLIDLDSRQTAIELGLII